MAKILIVDDDGMNLRMAAHALKAEYEIALAKSGEAGIENLLKGGIDLVLLDVEMPGMDGVATLKSIRENVAISDAKVAFLTGTIDDELTQKGKELGALGFIQKPFAPADLMSKVKSII